MTRIPSFPMRQNKDVIVFGITHTATDKEHTCRIEKVKF